MFEYDNTQGNNDTFNKKDKRPDLQSDEKEWIKGHYVNMKPGSLSIETTSTSFIAYVDTEDGYEEYKITLVKTDNNRTIMCQNRFGRGDEVCYYEIENKTGKIISKQSITAGEPFPRRVYDENGKVHSDKLSLKDMMNDAIKEKQEELSKPLPVDPSQIHW